MCLVKEILGKQTGRGVALGHSQLLLFAIAKPLGLATPLTMFFWEIFVVK
jgi:hypothetical protein